MKKILSVMLIWLIVVAVLYCLFAFVAVSFDIRQWDIMGHMLMALLAAITAACIISNIDP